jgi:hypothetical protein
MHCVSTDESLKLLCKRKAGSTLEQGNAAAESLRFPLSTISASELRVHMPLKQIQFLASSCQFSDGIWGQRQIAENRLVLVDSSIASGHGLRAAGWLRGINERSGVRTERNVNIGCEATHA